MKHTLPRPMTRWTYMPTDPNPFIRLAKFDRAMQAADRIAEEQEA